MNPSDVDVDEEGAHLLDALTAPSEWTSLSSWTGFLSSLPASSHAVIPELENGRPTAQSFQSVIVQNWLSAGGRLIVAAHDNNAALLNTMLSWSLSTSSCSGPWSRTSGSDDILTGKTVPSILTYANGMKCLSQSRLPSQSAKLYASSATSEPVVAMPYGDGWVVWLGHDYYASSAVEWKQLAKALTAGTVIPGPSPSPSPGGSAASTYKAIESDHDGWYQRVLAVV